MPLFPTPNVRDLLSREPKEKVPPDLKKAFSLLRISGYEELQERFLATDAFLTPWSTFRDAMFLFAPDAITRVTKITDRTEDCTGISRLGILWFYNQFEEGNLRYDSRADKWSEDFTPDSSVYGVIDKSRWRIEDHEKHLYAWLLQEFRVGKGCNPWRFDYLEYKNICSAWVEVFVPIINAVRASYHTNGKKHYGQLAVFVESKCPSRVAFPDSNVGLPGNEIMHPVPYRVVSVPLKIGNSEEMKNYQQQHVETRGVLAKKHYDETEKELRDVYPQYGGLVERPKFKHKMEEWLAEQRARADLRKAHEGGSKTQLVQTHVFSRPRNKNEGDGSSIKRYSDTIRHSLTRAVSSIKIKEEQKNPLHGLTRQLHFQESSASPEPNGGDKDSTVEPSPSPCAEQHRESSEGSVYSSDKIESPDSSGAVFSPMAQLSAVPRPLYPMSDQNVKPSHEDRLDIDEKKLAYNTRVPSYEGTGYQEEISLTNLHASRNPSTSSHRTLRKIPATRLPAPIIPIPYGGTRTAAVDAPSNTITPMTKVILSPPKPVAMPCIPVLAPPQRVLSSDAVAPKPKVGALNGKPAPKIIAWPGFDPDDDDISLTSSVRDLTPAVPPRSPERRKSTRAPGEIQNPRARELVGQAREMQHIVSMENIRAAVGRPSSDSMEEEETMKPFAKPPTILTPMKKQLQPFNKNMFPRKEGGRGRADL